MNLLYSTGGVKIWPIMKSLYSVFANVGVGESALVAGARWQNRELDFHDWLVMTGECVSRCHELSRWCVTQCCRHVLWSRSGRHTTKNGPISTDNHSQLAPNCKHFHSSFTLYTCCSPSFGERHFHTKYVITSSLRRADRLLSLPLLSAFLFASIHPPILPTEVQIMLLIIKC